MTGPGCPLESIEQAVVRVSSMGREIKDATGQVARSQEPTNVATCIGVVHAIDRVMRPCGKCQVVCINWLLIAYPHDCG